MRESSNVPDAGVDLDDELVRLRIEDAIADLDGIEAVRLVPGSTRPVDELHVVVAPDRDPKQTVRDLQSLLLANFGVDVDRRVVSVVRLGDDAGKRLRDGLPRLVLSAVRIEVRGGQTVVAVDLAGHDEHGDHVGSAGHVGATAGPASETAVAAAACEATLEALAGGLGDVTLRLVGASVTAVGSERVALVALTATNGRTRDLLTGSAVVRTHEADAAARAVLDATNRLHRDPAGG